MSKGLLSYDRNLDYLNHRQIIYRTVPTETPTVEYEWGRYYANGTYECYELFRSKAKINTYKSLKWHLLVLWYLNPSMNPDDFKDLATIITEKSNGFTTFNVSKGLLEHVIYEVSMSDLEKPPKNRRRKVIFDVNCYLTPEEKLSITGKLVGRKKIVHTDDVYDAIKSGIERGFLDENGNLITGQQPDTSGSVGGVQAGTAAIPEPDDALARFSAGLSASEEGRRGLLQQMLAEQAQLSNIPDYLQTQRRQAFDPLQAESILGFAGQFPTSPGTTYDFADFVRGQRPAAAGITPQGRLGSPINTYGGFNQLLGGVQGLYETPFQNLTDEQLTARNILQGNAADIIMQSSLAGIAPLARSAMQNVISNRLQATPIGQEGNVFERFMELGRGQGGYRVPRASDWASWGI